MWSLRTIIATASFITYAAAAQLTQITENFGPNPNGSGFYIYVPDKLRVPAPVVVAVHYCTGTGPAYYQNTKYARDADTKGYIVIYPSASAPGGCWDVASPATLKHLGGGDSLAIHSMVQWTLNKYNTDRNQVFVTGTSSGAMMTNVLLGAYPDVFAAGSAYAGVPFGCFAGPTAWNSQCATGQIIKTPQQWGDLVRAAYPGYNGKRPRMQLFHGDKDETLYFPNFGEETKQWTNVLGLSQTPTITQQNTPRATWIKRIYGAGQVETIQETGQTHNLVIMEDETLRFFGLDKLPLLSVSAEHGKLNIDVNIPH
ncbi:esterase/lipase [Pyronema domesticum]|uniref:Carboxylic ester hydrolase n=1 Tax=Pyronema omphalodes (strain CBS 100304) TaxID=1076935 RepID=U4LLS6_PYROM|nr:esterase/lipase [Pyronema domesticum]CCX14328.1 Similar to Acetylxylan esterase A; acc. no. Q5B037 [Pyronema omphalodes CBS 100304]